jgi:hypothetical protein
MTLMKCDAFHKKPDGSWEANSRDGPTVDESSEIFLQMFCNAQSEPFGLQHFPFKIG